MKRLLLALTVIASMPALADHDPPNGPAPNVYYVDADVVDVVPIVERRIVRTPREVCETRYARNDYDRLDHDPGPGPSIVGGILGGLVGHQFGHGDARKAFTIAGAFAGASIANARARANHRHRHVRRRPRTQCHTVTDEEMVSTTEGYRVTYAYHGRHFVKEMDSYPDEQIRIRVEVSPEL